MSSESEHHRTLVELLRDRAQHRPAGVPHVFSQDGNHERAPMTYFELDHGAQYVCALLAETCRTGDRALLVFPPGLDFDRAFWGCLYAGVIAVPLPLPSTSRTDTAMAKLLAVARDCDARVVVTTSSYAERLSGALASGGYRGAMTVLAIDEPRPQVGLRAPVPVTPDMVAYLQYSSGSTGAPKGVVLPHRTVCANAAVIGSAAALRDGTTGVTWLPTFHDMGLLSGVILPVVYDFTAYRIPPVVFVQRPLSWLRLQAEVRGTLSVAPNFAFALCVRRVSDAQAAELDLSHWQTIICGAEPIRPEVLRAFVRHFAPSGLSETALLPCYGLAEATLFVTGGPAWTGMSTLKIDPDEVGRGRAVISEQGREYASCGRLREEMPLVIADCETGTALGEMAVGEICVAGESVATGYWDNPVATAETFGVLVEGADGLFMRTGDLGFVRNGELYVTGRWKDVIIVDGVNHYPQDVEATVAGSHPVLAGAVCAAFQTPANPAERLVIVAEVDRAARRPGLADESWTAMLDDAVDEARRAVNRGHQLSLDEVLLVRAGTLPRTSSGKIQRYKCRDLYRAGLFTPRALRGAAPAELVS